MIRRELKVDVTEACDLGIPLTVAATVLLPEPDRLVRDAAIIFALPGGGYTRDYYDLNLPGHDDYSQAQYHTDHGWPVVAIDHLGVGDSTPEVCARITIEDIAAANHAAVQKIAGLLAGGDVVDGYPALTNNRKIGIGQSMGGGVTVIMAAQQRTYDAIGVLGYSAIHTVLPLRHQEETDAAADRLNLSRQHTLEEIPEDAASRLPDILYPFYWDDVPRDIVELDTSGGYPIRTTAPSFGSLTLPHCVAAMLSEGYIREEAAAIDVPVFLGFGSRDVARRPHDEPGAYLNSSDITLSIIDRMAHMHNFAGSRRELWDRLEQWFSAIDH